MTTIDDKVVAMSFESKQFEQGVAKTISSLDKLKAALHFPNAGKSFHDIDAASRKVDLSHISQGVDKVSKALESLRLIAIGVMAQLTTQAVRAGGTFVKAFTLDPAKAGFKEYSTNLNAVQTILANTQASGAGLKEVNAALDELNAYSDKTIYNFSQMARNIGTFTAAGVDLDTATASIKGIANLAALSGSNAEQASTAMYQLSQAIAAGSVKLMDWNSVVNAGMGGTVFQRALALTGEHMGKLKKGTVELVGPMKNVKIAGESFRNSLSAPGKDGWLTSDVLTKTLKMFTSDMTDAELAAEGWNKEQIKAIQTQANTAMLAATNVKTLQQVIDVARETAGSGWAKTWQIVFGDFMEAKQTFTRLSTAVNGFINDSARARNNVLADWKELGGRTVLIESIARAFHNLGMILKPIKDAFRQFFPAKTASDLLYLTQQFEALTFKLRPSVKTIYQIRHTFAGLFAVLDIGWEIIKGVVGVFVDLIGATGAGSGGFLSFTNNVGNALVAFHEWLIEGGRLAAFFAKLTAVLKAPVELFRALSKALRDLFSGISFGGFTKEVDGVTKAMTPFQKVMEGVATVWEHFLDAVGNSGQVLRPALDAVLNFIVGLGTAIGNAAANMNFEAILSVLRTGFLGALVIMFKKFLGRGSAIDQITNGFGGGILKNISGSFEALQGRMVAMQNNVKADTLQKIAIAIALLTASVVALSFVDPDKLKSSLTAMGVGFAQLLGAMVILGNISTSAGFLKIPFIAGSLILLAGAIDVLAIAVIALSLLSWEQLAKGLGGVAALLVGLTKAVVPLTANAAGMVRAGVGIAAIAAGLLVMAVAVRIMGTMDLDDLGKGLGGIAAGLVLMVFAMNKMPFIPVQGTAGLIAMAGALVILATAVKMLGSMDLQSLGKGLAGIASGLILMVFAMQKMPAASMAKNAAALLLMAGAIYVISQAVVKMGGQSLKQLGKGLGSLAVSLGLLAGALYLMSGSLAGAAALGIAAAGIAVLAPALVLLGKQSWGTIIKGLVAVGAAFAIIGIAGALITPAIPGLMGLGVALVLIGGAFALVGAGVFLIAAGFSALIVALPTGVGILLTAMKEIITALPEMVTELVMGLLEIVNMLADTAPKFAIALGKIIDTLLDIVIQSVPKLYIAFGVLLDSALKSLHDNMPDIIQAGFDLLFALLTGIRNNIPKIVPLVAEIIIKFLNSLTNKAREISAAGVRLLIALLKGVSDKLSLIINAVAGIVTKFITELGKKAKDIIIAGGKFVVSIITGISGSLEDIITAAGNLIVKFIVGLGKKQKDIIDAGKKLIIDFIKGLGKAATEIAKACADTITDFAVALAAAIDDNEGEFQAAGRSIAWSIADGITLGLAGKARSVATSAWNLGKRAANAVAEGAGVDSPSKLTMESGKFIAEGLILGLNQNSKNVAKSATAIGTGLIDAFNSVFEITSPSKVMYKIGQFVVQGFANGLIGSADDIRNAFAAMKQRLKDDIVSVRDDIAAENDRLAEMLEKKQDKLDDINAKKWKKAGDKAKAIADVQKEYTKAIDESKASIKSNEAALAALTATQKTLTKSLQDEKVKLINLSTQLDKVNEKLKAAHDKLIQIKEERDAFAKEQGDKYGAPPEISEPLTEEIKSARQNIEKEQQKLNALLGAGTQDLEKIADARVSLTEAQAGLDELVKGKILTGDGSSVDVVKTYLADLNAQQLAVAAYGKTLAQLRTMGLDEKTYRMLVEDGVASQGFAEALLAGGLTAVTGINKLDEDIKIEADKLATNSAAYLYAAGIKTAEDMIQGLIKGIKGEKGKKQLQTEINKLAKFIIAEMRKGLKEKSPSQEFMTIGELAMEGLALGFKNSSGMVSKAVDNAAKDAIGAMKRSMRYISDAVTNELNTDPVITPILDLTQVRSQSGELANLIPITAATSYGQAAAISADQNAAQVEESIMGIGGASVKFEQNNYSPTALTNIEIYRQTRNQLSQFKSVLAT